MILELDAGNTNLKWRLMDADGPLGIKQRGGIISIAENSSQILMELSEQFNNLPFSIIQRVKVSSVQGREFEDMLAAELINKWQLKAEFAKVEKQCGGIINSYNAISNMGIDRWLAMLAAFKDAKGACCIVDCGSAITLDLVEKNGEHLGGYIVPGFSLMKEALARKSSALNIDTEFQYDLEPGTATGVAMANGSLNMVLGLIEMINSRYQNFSWYISGGDADLIAPYISFEFKVVPDLVLDGLAVSIT